MEHTNFSVIYQDHYLLIVNKPAGIVIHPTYKHPGDTMWNSIVAYVEEQGGDDWLPPDLPDEPRWAEAPEHIREMLRSQRTERLWKEEGLLPRPCLLHRLDKDTSGVVALARTERSRRHLIRQFEDHTIVKRYLAVARKGAPDWSKPQAPFTVARLEDGKKEIRLDIPINLASFNDLELILDGPLQRDPTDRRRCIIGPNGQHAKTIVRVLAVEGEFVLLEARPVTGRTHQIRAHLAALGYAIVGDSIYGLPIESGKKESALNRQFLHAYSLELRSYPHNTLYTFVAPLADDLLQWMERYFPKALGALDASAIPT